MLRHTQALIKIPLTNVGYERPNDYPILGGSPSLKCSSHKRGGTIAIPIYWGTLQVKSHNLVARHSYRVWFDDGHETHNNMSLSTSLHRCLAPLAPILFFMMVVKSLHLLHYIEIWLHWCQHFGHGSIGTDCWIDIHIFFLLLPTN